MRVVAGVTGRAARGRGAATGRRCNESESVDVKVKVQDQVSHCKKGVEGGEGYRSKGSKSELFDTKSQRSLMKEAERGSCMCICIYIYVYTHTHTYIYIDIYTYIYRYMYMYTCFFCFIHIYIYIYTQ